MPNPSPPPPPPKRDHLISTCRVVVTVVEMSRWIIYSIDRRTIKLPSRVVIVSTRRVHSLCRDLPHTWNKLRERRPHLPLIRPPPPIPGNQVVLPSAPPSPTQPSGLLTSQWQKSKTYSWMFTQGTGDYKVPNLERKPPSRPSFYPSIVLRITIESIGGFTLTSRRQSFRAFPFRVKTKGHQKPPFTFILKRKFFFFACSWKSRKKRSCSTRPTEVQV